MKLNRANLHEYQKYGVDFIINNPISGTYAGMRSWQDDNNTHSCK